MGRHAFAPRDSPHAGDVDPWWRSPTPQRHLDPLIAQSLRSARRRQGWSLRRAAEIVGISAGYLCLLEQGKRVPSTIVARSLVEVYADLPEQIIARLEAVARRYAGRLSPYKSGDAAPATEGPRERGHSEDYGERLESPWSWKTRGPSDADPTP